VPPCPDSIQPRLGIVTFRFSECLEQRSCGRCIEGHPQHRFTAGLTHIQGQLPFHLRHGLYPKPNHGRGTTRRALLLIDFDELLGARLPEGHPDQPPIKPIPQD